MDDGTKKTAIQALTKLELWQWMVVGGLSVIAGALVAGSFGLGAITDDVRHELILCGVGLMILAIVPWYLNERDKNADRTEWLKYKTEKRKDYLDRGMEPPEGDPTTFEND